WSAGSYLLVILFLAIFAIGWRFRKGWGSYALLGFGAYALLLFPVLGFFDSQFLTKWRVSDHLQYLPLIAVAAMLAGFARFRALQLIIVLTFGCLAFHRAQAFASAEVLFRDTLRKNPNAWGTQLDLGVILASRENYPEAIEHFEASLKARTNNP